MNISSWPSCMQLCGKKHRFKECTVEKVIPCVVWRKEGKERVNYFHLDTTRKCVPWWFGRLI